jgi:hypothetical protein
MRQFARTVTAQNPLISPLSGCRRKPGKLISSGFGAVQDEKNILDLLDQVGTNAFPIPVLEKPLESFVIHALGLKLKVATYILASGGTLSNFQFVKKLVAPRANAAAPF